MTFDGLPAGHRHGVVEQDLVGHVDAGGHRGTDRERARVRVGAVAQVLEHVRRRGERGLPDPRRTLAAHLRERDGIAIHPGGHVVATDAADRAAAFGHARRGVVRTARAEVRLPLHLVADRREPSILLLEKPHALLDVGARVEAAHALGEHARDERRRELAVRRQQPLAALVLLADDQRPPLRVPVVELLFDLALDDAALFLDDDDFLEALGEAPNRLGLERPGEADLEQLDADVGGTRPIDAEILERLQHVEMGFTRRHQPKPRVAAIDDRAIERVGPRERERGRQLVALQPELLIVRRIGPADVQAAGRQRELRRHDGERLRQQCETLRRVSRLLRHLEPDPTAAEARHGVTVEPERDDLLDVGRIQHGHRSIDERVLALMRQRRRLARVVVAGDRDDAAVARSSGRVAVLEWIAGTVDARTLAVPHAEDAVIAGALEQIRLLRAPDRGRGEILVQSRLKTNLRRVEVLAGAPELSVEAAERRAAIARHETRGIQSRKPVAMALRQQQADQRLQTGDEQRPGIVEPVPVIQSCDLPELHASPELPRTGCALGIMGLFGVIARRACAARRR